MYSAAVVTSSSGIATSLSPTIEVSGETGAWSFVVTDLLGGKNFSRSYQSSTNRVRIPQGAGLVQGNVYSWSATGPDGRRAAGSFRVDVQRFGVQPTDTVGGVSVGLASGEPFASWKSHTMRSAAGEVGFGLRYAASNPASPGVPAGWDLSVSSGSRFTRLIAAVDGTVSLIGSDGSTTSYALKGDAYAPVVVSGQFAATGLAPVLSKNSDDTWTVVDKQVTSLFGVADATGNAFLTGVVADRRPAIEQQWSDGLLRAALDPVSGRSITFSYGGDKGCVGASNGFVAAPAGMLCLVTFWDGTTTVIRYVDTGTGSPGIGRILDLANAGADGAVANDIAYDAIGRVARLRSPLVNAAAASGRVAADDPQYWLEVSYDEDGRAVAVTNGAPSEGAKRVSHAYSYSSVRTTTVTDVLLGRTSNEVRFDPATFYTLSTTDILGRVATNEWDYATGNLRRTVDYNGNVTVNTIVDGRVVDARGPTRGSLATQAQVMSYEYDQAFDQSADGTAMHGLDVTYFGNADFLGGSVSSELGPRIDGRVVPSLTVNWATSPTGTGSWSARMSGSIQVTTQGEYTFSTAGEGTSVWIDNISCERNGCTRLPLTVGSHSIRIDKRSAQAETSMGVQWSGPDTGGSPQSIPTARVTPEYGLVTTVRSNDVTSATATAESVVHSQFDEPSTGQVTKKVNQAGLVSSLSYADAAGSDGKWGQQVASELPGGNSYRYVYWGDKESAKSSCPGAQSANQGGMVKSTVVPGPDGGEGPVSSKWYAASGALTAATGLDGSTTCASYDKAGRLIRLEVLGGEKQVRVIEYAVDGNPLVSSITDTIGRTTRTTLTTIDLEGRTVRTLDPDGVLTVINYDQATGGIATQSVTAPSAAPVVTSNRWLPSGYLESVSVNGRTVATVTYNDDGTERAIAYANGVTVALGYDDSVRASSAVWKSSDGHTMSNTRELSAGGRIMTASHAVDAKASVFQYVYDAARRLADVTLTGDLVAAHKWSYTYDANSNRLTSTTDGATVTNTYNRADQLVSSTDPRVGMVEYDQAGNVIRIGSDRFEYSVGSRLRSATDGKRTVDYSRAVDGTIVAVTTTDAAGASTTRFATSGVTLDGEGRAIALRMALPGTALLTLPLAGGAPAWQYNDLAGNKFWTSDDAGVPTGTAQVYEPFGAALTTPDPIVPGVANQAWVALTGNSTVDLDLPYVMMGVRVYVPSIGRFLQPDPKVGGSANAYDYGSQDPVNNVDGTGRSWWAEIIGAVVVATLSAIFMPVAPAIAGFASVAIGAAVGAVAGIVGYAVTFGLEQIGGNGPSWDWTQVAWAAGIGALLGGAGAAIKWAKVTSRIDRYNATGEVQVKGKWVAGTPPVEPVPRASFWSNAKPPQTKPLDVVEDFFSFLGEETGSTTGGSLVFETQNTGSSILKIARVDRGLSNRISGLID